MVCVYSNSVTIGPEFFRKAFNDYRNKHWAFVREILQNSIDCGSTLIEATVFYDEEDDVTHVEVFNNGSPMTEEILVNKLLSLGSSGKDFQGAVGGFGKAKEILYFAHRDYKIQSGQWIVAGSGAGYNITPVMTSLEGTRSTVTWAGDASESLRRNFSRFVSLCNRRNVRFTLNGEDVPQTIPRFRIQRPLEMDGVAWANLGVNYFEPNLLLVRIAGIPMFHERTEFAGTIVLELQGTSGDRLTANRDSLRYPYSTRLTDLITQMAVDKSSALKLEKPTYTKYGGPRLRHAGEAHEPETVFAQVADKEERLGPEGGILVLPQGRFEHKSSLLPYQFINKNCVRRKIPREFDPLDLKFSNYAYWLANAWSGCLLELHQHYEIGTPFTVGFVFSDMAEAEFESSSEYGRVFFLNPCKIGKRSTRRRFKRSDRGQIAADAAHEFVHGCLDIHYHGEDYANRLTEVAGMMFNNWRKFAKHF